MYWEICPSAGKKTITHSKTLLNLTIFVLFVTKDIDRWHVYVLPHGHEFIYFCLLNVFAKYSIIDIKGYLDEVADWINF